ncbi:glycoside hydrolase 100 family protein [Zunongwangia sp. HGR-M22]|uniref:glycoside hydrolase 100 family protein n=1 Tax=Zunongwangia sp. HGR-M22 TaxID=3015168 RepID=UPI0022DD56CF|nr:glycoside hydrolase 100 family protein [Zunongwangia sp. HGR-M22]WBL24208.1 amylo-alpha-1,6-glucosidase [Zunongwangia sp. HGR-M22]
MKIEENAILNHTKKTALEILLNNSRKSTEGLSRTAAWGYPEPYTRDLMLAILGVAVSKNEELIANYKHILEVLASNQTRRGHIPSLINDKENRGASDTTPLFLFGVSIFRKINNQPAFQKKAVKKALKWMKYQSPTDRYLIAQQPTSDWRDEQWILGYGLFVNTILYAALKGLGKNKRATHLAGEIQYLAINNQLTDDILDEDVLITLKPYYNSWSYKIYHNDRFDLLGNSIAILTGLASPKRAKAIIKWVEQECNIMKEKNMLRGDLPPNFFPFIQPNDRDWFDRYAHFNLPGNYHNGGIWPFITALYIAALVNIKEYELAENKLIALAHLLKLANQKNRDYGFNEWYKAQDNTAMGEDWQTWSAALYLYASHCVEQRDTPFF